MQVCTYEYVRPLIFDWRTPLVTAHCSQVKLMQALVWHPKRRTQPVLIPRETVLWVLVKVGLGLRARVAIDSDNATLIFATVKISHRTKQIFSNDKANVISGPQYRAINSSLDSETVSVDRENL